LQEYVIKHFTDEQLLHKSVGYTKASTHAGYHDAFIRTLKDLIAKVNREGTTLAVTINVSQIVTTWLTDHILVHDMEFSRFYRNKKQEER
jgi:hemerythrin